MYLNFKKFHEEIISTESEMYMIKTGVTFIPAGTVHIIYMLYIYKSIYILLRIGSVHTYRYAFSRYHLIKECSHLYFSFERTGTPYSYSKA